jgi:hypothetical protein
LFGLVRSRSWDDARPTKKVADDLDQCIGNRLGRESTSDDQLLHLDLSRRVFLDYLLMLTGGAPEDDEDR